MASPQVSTPIPQAVFRAADERPQQHKWSTDAYVDEVTAILQEAAGIGLTDQYWLTKPGKPLVPLTNRGAARLLLQKLVEHHRQRRAGRGRGHQAASAAGGDRAMRFWSRHSG